MINLKDKTGKIFHFYYEMLPKPTTTESMR